MYGQYSELQRFAREFASRSSYRREQQRMPPTVEEARHRKSRSWMTWKYLSTHVLPYIIDWFFISILGILMAVLSFIIDYLIEQIRRAHVVLSLKLIENVVLQYLFWIGFPVVFVLFSVGFVQVVSIHAIGSGIPEMKTVLRGITLTDYLSFRTFISKAVGLVAAVGSGLPIGKEGPFVHLSSIIAHLMSKLITTVNRVYANEAHSNELLAAACAVGVSCNFAAPIGGVLFSIEVTATYFAVRNYWRGFYGAVCGAFLFQLAAVWFKEEETITALFKTSFNVDFPFDPYELLAFGFIGIVCGFFGALFVYYHRKYVTLRRKYRKYTKWLEFHIFILPALVAIVFSTLTFRPALGQFMAGELSQREAIQQLFSNQTWVRLPSPSLIEELPIESPDRLLVRNWGSPNIWVSLILFMIVRYIFTAIAVSLPLPSGLFFPIFVVGAAFGRLVGELMVLWFPTGIDGNLISPGGYAVVGAAALAGATTHTISTSVIVFELTGQITHILPVMIAVLIANAVASILQPSVYDSIILLKGLSYLPDLKPNKFYNLYATDIMETRLDFLSYQSTYHELNDLLQATDNESYPLVDAPESRILIGSVSRLTLKALLDEHMKGVYEHAQQIREHTRDHVVFHKSTQEEEEDQLEISSSPSRNSPSPLPDTHGFSLSRKLSSVPHSLAKLFGGQEDVDTNVDLLENGSEHSTEIQQLRDQQLSHIIDFKKTHIDPAPFQLVERSSLYKIHSLFSILALSHAYVTSIGRLVGVVTLSDLSDAIHGKMKQRDVFLERPTPVFDLQPPDEESAADLNVPPLNLTVQ